MTSLLPRTAPGTANRIPPDRIPPDRIPPGPPVRSTQPGPEHRGRPASPAMVAALAELRADPARSCTQVAAAHDVKPASLARAASRAGLENPLHPGGARAPRQARWAPGIEPPAGLPTSLRLPPEAHAVALHLGAARMRHLLMTVGAALQQRADEAAEVATATRAAGGRLGLVGPNVEAVHARPLTITLPPVLRPAKRQEHGRTLYLPDPDQPTAPAFTEHARERRAAVRAGGLAPVDAMARAHRLPTLGDTLAMLGRVVEACRRLAAEGRMPANVGALRDACDLLEVPHLTTPREPKT